MAALKGDGLRAAILFVRMKGLEPPRPETLDPKSNAATNYATCAGLRAKVGIFLEIAKFFFIWRGRELLGALGVLGVLGGVGGGRRTGRTSQTSQTGQTGQTGPAGGAFWGERGERGGWTLCEAAAALGSSPTFLGDCSYLLLLLLLLFGGEGGVH